ncbi:MAG: hypothetical protein U0168_29410 [Nannocystaceae bacterium]
MRVRLHALLCALCMTTAFAALPQPADAAKKRPRGSRRIGLGGGLGDPTGPSLKLFLAPQHALQFDFGWAPMHHGNGIIHANYLFHFPTFVSNSVMDFGLYLGVGLGMAFWSGYGYYGYHHYGYYGPYYDPRGCYDPPGPDPVDCRYYANHGGAAMILRAPVGLFFHWMKVPLDTVVEGGWSPYVVRPDLAHGDFSVKLRYYF